MTRIILACILLLIIAVTLFIIVQLHVRQPRKPSPSESNAQWAEYYQRMAEEAYRSKNEDSAAEYESLARTYSQFDSKDM